MQFCVNCSNMYYIRLDSENPNKLIYYCRNCGHEETNMGDDVCISKTQIKRVDQKYKNIINEFTKLDPTLPRVFDIPCPNSDCQSHEENGSKEVLYLRYDDKNLKFVYICATCDTTWTS